MFDEFLVRAFCPETVLRDKGRQTYEDLHVLLVLKQYYVTRKGRQTYEDLHVLLVLKLYYVTRKGRQTYEDLHVLLQKLRH